MQKNRKMGKIGALIGVMGLCVVVIALIVTSINQFKLGSQLAGINQVSNLSHLLVRQQAKLFSLLLVQKDKDAELLEALETFAQEDFVLDATVYSPTGTILAQSAEARPFIPFLAENQQKKKTQQIVEPILAQQNLVGFLRVTFDTQYGQTTQNKINELFHLLYGDLIILFLTGGLFASCFYYFSRRRAYAVVAKSTPLIEETKTQTQRFHSRRRPFGRK